jgi:hypothetical protein
MSGHNYHRKIRQMLASGILPRAELHYLDIHHEPGCAVFRGGLCNCDPQISNLFNAQNARCGQPAPRSSGLTIWVPPAMEGVDAD